jgi:hypothetical protein
MEGRTRTRPKFSEGIDWLANIRRFPPKMISGQDSISHCIHQLCECINFVHRISVKKIGVEASVISVSDAKQAARVLPGIPYVSQHNLVRDKRMGPDDYHT